MSYGSERKLMRRVAGSHNIRLDGVSDILMRARDAAVLDVGCNRGMVAYEFAQNGAAIVHGCDQYEEGIATAREVFTDLRSVKSQFEVVDLTRSDALSPFGNQKYDITVMLATYHKLKRIMKPEDLTALIELLRTRTETFFVWRGTNERLDNHDEMRNLDRDLIGFKRVQTSYISKEIGASAIWERQK